MSRLRKTQKPSKPDKDFPLWPHPSGRWCRKIKGRFHYFGPWSNPRAALDKWNREKDDLLAGRTPRGQENRDALDVVGLCNAFMTVKENRVTSGELRRSTFEEYHRTLAQFVAYFGKHRAAVDITPAEFEAFRAHLAKGIGLTELAKRVQIVRSAYKHAVEADLLDKGPKFGQFKGPPLKAIRKARASKPSRMLEPAELRKIIKAAGVPLKAMVLLGLNCGFGQSDIAALPSSAVDLKAGFVTFPRPKTGARRRCPLWRETVQAIRKAMDSRPDTRDTADAGLVFITSTGRRWVRFQASRKRDGGTWVDSVNLRFRAVLDKFELKREGLGFYALRRIHRTIADAVNDQPAAALIMGHADPGDMASRYVETIGDDRLLNVTNHVHKWVFGRLSLEHG